MLYTFLANNRDELITRCRAKVAQRPARDASVLQLENGIPLFLHQLIETLRIEQSDRPADSVYVSGSPGGHAGRSDIGEAAAQHGHELLRLGYTVDQVVHDYGDLCQAITDLAHERDAPFSIDEFRTLNRCLDNAIADAVTEFSYQRDSKMATQQALEEGERMGAFAHELRNFLHTATLAFEAAKAGNLPLFGATGAVLDRSLKGLGKLIERSIEEARRPAPDSAKWTLFSLSEFIGETKQAANLAAQLRGCGFVVTPVDPHLAVSGNRDLLYSALGNLIQNAFKFTQPNTDVTLNAYAVADKILIEVKDHGGGLPPGKAEQMFLPFAQFGADKSGLGLGLSIARRSVELNDGFLSVRDIPGVGCVFTISLPRHTLMKK